MTTLVNEKSTYPRLSRGCINRLWSITKQLKLELNEVSEEEKNREQHAAKKGFKFATIKLVPQIVELYLSK